MRAGDKILVVVLIALAVAYFAYDYFSTEDSDQLIAVVSQSGKVVKEIPLTEVNDGEYIFEWNGHHNIVKIDNQSVEVLAADCPHQYCVRQGKISAAGESIICLPHRFVVEIKATTKNEVDFIVR